MFRNLTNEQLRELMDRAQPGHDNLATLIGLGLTYLRMGIADELAARAEGQEPQAQEPAPPQAASGRAGRRAGAQ